MHSHGFSIVGEQVQTRAANRSVNHFKKYVVYQGRQQPGKEAAICIETRFKKVTGEQTEPVTPEVTTIHFVDAAAYFFVTLK